jgi:hypothetical protein
MREFFRSRLAVAAVAFALLFAVAAPTLAADSQPLVSPAWLNEHLKDRDLVVLDDFIYSEPLPK